MPRTAQEYLALSREPAVAAFLRVIRQGESGQGDDAYTVINGGTHFAPDQAGWAHPFHGIPTTQGARASGAYQFLGTTWARLVEKYGFPDFSPPWQDAGAVALIDGRGALDDVRAGRLEAAIAKLRQEWTSLPGAAENSGRYTMADAWAVFRKYGGGVEAEQEPAPVEDRVAVPEEGHMGPAIPILLGLLPELVKLIPTLGTLFGSGSETQKRNIAAAAAVAETVVKATETPNLQAAIEKMAAEPEVKAVVAQAVQPLIDQLVEVGGGIEAARKAAIDPTALPFWRQGVFWIACLFMLPIYYTVWHVLSDNLISSELKGAVIGAVMSLMVAGITGYFFGTSAGSARKSELMVKKE